MLFWISLAIGLVLALMTAGLVLSMSRAERRARRNLYRSLGLAETTVEFLMERNRDVLTELTYVRREGEAKIRREALPRGANISALRASAQLERNLGQGSILGDEAPPASGMSSATDGQTRH